MWVDRWQRTKPCPYRERAGEAGRSEDRPLAQETAHIFSGLGGLPCTAQMVEWLLEHRQTLCPPKYLIHLLIHAWNSCMRGSL